MTAFVGTGPVVMGAITLVPSARRGALQAVLGLGSRNHFKIHLLVRVD